jgi:hypothetical protein
MIGLDVYTAANRQMEATNAASFRRENVSRLAPPASHRMIVLHALL